MSKKTIPDFKSEKEEQEFWATHSAMDYEMEEVEEELRVEPRARTKPVSIRLSEKLITNLKEIASEEGLPYQTLIKMCLEKFVEKREQKRLLKANS